MEVSFIGHATFRISSSSFNFIIDPYEPMSFNGRFNYPFFNGHCDYYTATHHHIDHDSSHSLSGNAVRIEDSFDGEVFSVRSVKAFHDIHQGRDFGGEIQIKRICCEGMSIVHLGDLGHVLNRYQIEKLLPIDILLVPVGGFYTLDASKAIIVIKQLKPVITIPYHYLTPYTSLRLDPLENFLELYSKNFLSPVIAHHSSTISFLSAPRREACVVLKSESVFGL